MAAVEGVDAKAGLMGVDAGSNVELADPLTCDSPKFSLLCSDANKLPHRIPHASSPIRGPSSANPEFGRVVDTDSR